MSYNIPNPQKANLINLATNSLQVIHSTHTLVDNTVAWTDLPLHAGWTAATTKAIYLVYAITRGANPEVETGQMSIAVRSAAVAEAPLYVDSVTTTTGTGVTLQGVVSTGIVKIQYKTSNTGANATLELTVLRVV